MRFRFRGLYRDTGKPVEGHVEAAGTDAAYQVLSDNGIVTETLHEAPHSQNVSPTAIEDFAEALDDALDSSSSQIPFDALTQRYRGKKVWVIDREKIRQRVAHVVDSTLAASEADAGAGASVRDQVAKAIDDLFHDTRNIASHHDTDTIAKLRTMLGGAKRDASGSELSQQIGKLTDVVQQAEGLIAEMQAALRSVDSGGAPRRRLVAPSMSLGPEQNEVLREIFQSNLELRRLISKPGRTDVQAV